MPIDTLGEDVQRVLRGANTFLRSKQKNSQLRQVQLRELNGIEGRLAKEIEERSTKYIAQLESEEKTQIDNQWAQITSKPKFIEASKENKQTSRFSKICGKLTAALIQETSLQFCM